MRISVLDILFKSLFLPAPVQIFSELLVFLKRRISMNMTKQCNQSINHAHKIIKWKYPDEYTTRKAKVSEKWTNGEVHWGKHMVGFRNFRTAISMSGVYEEQPYLWVASPVWHLQSSDGDISEHVRTLFGGLYILGGQ